MYILLMRNIVEFDFDLLLSIVSLILGLYIGSEII